MNKNIFYEDYAKNLTGEYHDIYQQMSLYIIASLPPGDDGEEIMNEVIDLLLSSQVDKRPIKSVIGDDVKYFCDQMIESHNRSLVEKIIKFLNFYRIIALIGLIIEGLGLIFDFIDDIPSPWNSNVQMGLFFIITLLSLTITLVSKFFVKKAVFKFSWYTRKLDHILASVTIIAFFMSIFILPEEIDALITIPRWLFLIVMLTIYIIFTIQKKKNINKQKEEGSYISFMDEVSKDARNENILTLRKKYKKYIKKCKKKNKTPINVKEWYEVKFQKDKRGDLYGRIFFILMIVIAIVGTFLTSEFIDSLFFACLLLVIEIPIYRFLDKGRIMRLEIYDLIHELDTDIYDERLVTCGDSVLKEENYG